MASLEFPEWMHVNEEHSYLEGRQFQSRPDLNLDSLMDWSFQTDFEQYVSDLIPCRDDVLLANAAVQRQGISLAATLAGFVVYPIFYGSNR